MGRVVALSCGRVVVLCLVCGPWSMVFCPGFPMPELPEVETIRRTLQEHLRGRSIIAVDVFEQALRLPVAEDFAKRLSGKRVLEVGRRGKYLLVHLEHDWVWICHLGMSGKLVYSEQARQREKHDHIIVHLREGGELRFNDPRRFGLCVIMRQSELAAWPSLARMGIEPLGDALDGELLYALLRRSKRRVRDVLMDQRVIAGLGNIYVNEVLFRARVRPTVRASRISRRGARDIAREIRVVLGEAIGSRGTSFSAYRDGNDHRGAFQLRLRVYDRAGENCFVCSAVIKRKSVGNRGIYYCPKCQS